MWRFNYSIALAVFLAAPAGQGRAQPQAPRVPLQAPPTFSPYLNLARRDSSPAINYYGIVRPQVATRNNLQSLQQQIAMEGQQLGGAGGGVVNSDLPITGQPAFFLNTGGYFLNSRSGYVPSSITYSPRIAPPTPTRPTTIPARTR